MIPRIAVLLMLVLATELAFLALVARATSWWLALGLVVVMGLLGTWLIRLVGLRCWAKLNGNLRHGELPTDALLDALVILVAAVLMILPGLLSDMAALLMIVPAVRRRIRGYIRQRILARYSRLTGGLNPQPTPPVIDAEFRRVD